MAFSHHIETPEELKRHIPLPKPRDNKSMTSVVGWPIFLTGSLAEPEHQSLRVIAVLFWGQKQDHNCELVRLSKG